MPRTNIQPQAKKNKPIHKASPLRVCTGADFFFGVPFPFLLISKSMILIVHRKAAKDAENNYFSFPLRGRKRKRFSLAGLFL